MARCGLIALDLDGTALTPAHTLAPETCRAIQKARSQGVRVVIAAAARRPPGLPRRVVLTVWPPLWAERWWWTVKRENSSTAGTYPGTGAGRC